MDEDKFGNIADSAILDSISEDDGSLEVINQFDYEALIKSLENQINEISIKDVAQEDQLSGIRERIEFLRNKFADDDEILDKLDKQEADLLTLISSKIENKFDIHLELMYDDRYLENYYPIVYSMYRFFIIDYHKNMMTLFTSYISQNINQLFKDFKLTGISKKDLEGNLIKQNSSKKNKYLSILYNIPETIDQVIQELSYNPLSIIEYITKSDVKEITYSKIHDLFIIDEDEEELHEKNDTFTLTKGVLGDNFYENFIGSIIKEGNGYNSIKTNIRQFILPRLQKLISENDDAE